MKNFKQFINESANDYVYLAAILNSSTFMGEDPISEDSEIFATLSSAQDHIVDVFESLLEEEIDSIEDVNKLIKEDRTESNFYQIMKLEYNNY